jgi:hypothetical protein
MQRFLDQIAFCLLATFVGAVTLAGEDAADEAKIVLVSPVRIAFYEAAPSSLAGSMRNAVRATCASLKKSGAVPNPPAGRPNIAWLCNGTTLRYLRAVNVLGTKYKTGLVCSEGSVTPNLRYYTEDMFTEESECLFVAYSVKSHLNSIELPDVP